MLPDLGEGLQDAEVVKWLVEEGDSVDLNQPLVEVDTAKALVEIPSPVGGKVVTLHATEGETVKVGAKLVTFEVEGEEESGRTAVLVGYGAEEAKSSPRRRLSGTKIDTTRAGGVQAAPPVRKLAGELEVDLDAVSGTGPGGRITREDVLAAAASSKPSGPEERIAVRGVRKLVAEKMVRSVLEIPHVTTYLTADMTEVMRVQTEARKISGVKVTPLAYTGKALIEICKRHPGLNATWDGRKGEIVLKRYYHLGVATDTQRGLIVPVVRDADSHSVLDLAGEIERLSAAARDGKASPEELTGSTITISNVGTFAAEYGTPIINYPESAILALGVIEDRPVAREGQILVRPMVTFSLSFDHRILDGAEAGRALKDLKALLEDPDGIASL